MRPRRCVSATEEEQRSPGTHTEVRPGVVVVVLSPKPPPPMPRPRQSRRRGQSRRPCRQSRRPSSAAPAPASSDSCQAAAYAAEAATAHDAAGAAAAHAAAEAATAHAAVEAAAGAATAHAAAEAAAGAAAEAAAMFSSKTFRTSLFFRFRNFKFEIPRLARFLEAPRGVISPAGLFYRSGHSLCHSASGEDKMGFEVQLNLQFFFAPGQRPVLLSLVQ